MSAVDLQMFLRKIGISLSIVLALSVPGFYGVIGYANLEQRLELQAAFVARQLGHGIDADSAVWTHRVEQLIGPTEFPHYFRDSYRLRIFDGAGTKILEQGSAIAWPRLVRGAEIRTKGERYGYVEVETSLRPLLVRTLLAALIGGLLGLLAFWIIRVVPIRAIERALHAVEARCRQLDETLSSMSQGLCRFDARNAMVFANAKYREMFRLSKEQVAAGTTLRQLLEYRRANGTFKADPATFSQQEERRPEEILDLPDGRYIRALRHIMPDGGWISIFEDITERKAIESQRLYLAQHDALTDLANRVVFMEMLESACASLCGSGQGFGVLMLDLDKFKLVNDTLGHPVGDALLVRASHRLTYLLGSATTIARLGGDEFAIILIGPDDVRKAAEDVARQIVETLSEPFDIDGMKPVVGASVGISIAPDDGVDPVVLLKNADMALYRAKADGRNCHRFFDPEMLKEMEIRHQLESDLRAAIDNGEMELFYQPVVSAATGMLCGAEALLRWRHPVMGLVMPDKFIPIAEQTGLIVQLGEWVLQRACMDAASWPDHVKVAVNLSLAQFRKSNLPDVIMCAIVESGLAPSRLELEITETIFIANEAEHWTTLRQLKGIGISVALDDFGTGYSSLSYLTMFPFDKIKIDRSFTRNMATRESCAAVISAALAIGRGLNMATTAEGVETKEQFEMLRAAGVTSVQGYLFGQAMPASELDFSGDRPAPQRECAA